MFDVKKFLRIEISGYVCLLYFAVFTTCLFILFRRDFPVDVTGPGFWIQTALAGVPIAFIPGFIIHQLSIWYYNPFNENRKLFDGRVAIKSLKRSLDRWPESCQKTLERVDINGLFDVLAGLPSDKGDSYSEYLRGEISRRYSYYYARIDAGAFAPLLGLTLSVLFYLVFILEGVGDISRLLEWNTFARLIPLEVSFLLALFISIAIVGYCRKLFGEIDVLESALLAENYDYRYIKRVLKKYEQGIHEDL
jgi:hypothetical protein